MTRAPKDKFLAALTRGFAQYLGITDRQASRLRASGDARWKEYVTANTPATPPVNGDPSAPMLVDPPAQAAKADDDLSDPEKMVKQQWLIYIQSANSWRAAAKGGMTSAHALGGATIRAMEAFHKAKAKLEIWQIHERDLIPKVEYDQLIPFFDGLVALIRSCPSEIALNANPASPSTARSAIEAWLVNRFEPAARALAEQLP